MTSAWFCCLLAATVAASTDFQSFETTYGKLYPSEQERDSREAIFKSNVAEIEHLRLLNPQASFDINAYADLTAEEFEKRYTGYNAPNRQQPRAVAPTAPIDFRDKLTVAQVDWRTQGAVDPTVFDQGECGCCWAISVAQTVGSQWFLQNKAAPVPSLSFQQLICCDCKSDDAGCHGGDPHEAYAYIQQAGGLESTRAYPFTDSGPNAQSCNLNGKCNKCQFDAKKVAASITGYENVTFTDPGSGDPGNETALAEAVATSGPLSVCIDSDPWRFYQNGILDYGARNNLNHCVQLVGYDSTGATPYWILKNSWGEKWGEAGYIRMKMGMDICGVADVATRPLVSAAVPTPPVPAGPTPAPPGPAPPTPAAPTPSAPTPAAPTPTAPTPGPAPTPSAPTPSAPTPATPTPGPAPSKCDVSADSRVECTLTAITTEAKCKAANCCWNQTPITGIWCFKPASA